MSLCVAADGGKEKPKRKRAKPESISKHTTKKAKAHAAIHEKRAVMSAATDNISKINSNEVQKHDSSSTPNQTIFSSSLYTQELSHETHNSNEPVTETSTATNPEHVSAPESTQPSKNNEEWEATCGMEMPSDNDNETQFHVTATLDETVIHCSQDLFSSQTETTKQNVSEKNKADAATGIITDTGLHKLSTSSGASGRNVNAKHEENKTSEFTADSCMATVGERSDSEQIQNVDCTNTVLDVVADNNTAKDMAANDEDNHRILTEVESPASVLQPDTHNPSTSNEHSKCSDIIPLVPDIQQNNFQTRANQNCDAVVPQLVDDNFDDNSNDLLDFEPEE